jgi:rod shape-determining protein MreD
MIRAIFKWSALFIVSFTLQTTLIPVLTVFGIRPDLLMVALFLLAVRTGQMTAIWVGFFLGLSQDLYTPSVLGQNALSKAVAGFFAGFFNERVMRLDPLVQMVLLFLMFCIHDTLFYLIQAAKNGGGGNVIVQGLLTSAAPRAVYSMLFAILPYIKERFFPSSRWRR